MVSISFFIGMLVVLCGVTDKTKNKKWIPGYNFHNYLIVGYLC